MALMVSPISALLSLLTVLALPSNDLLDYVPTAAYWRLQQVNPTPAAMAAELAETSDAAAAAFIDEISNPDPQTRSQARRNLAGLGRKALPLLRAAMEGGDPETMATSRELIAQISAQSKPKAIRRLMAIRALGESGDAGALAVLAPLLKSTEPFEAEYAAAAMSALRRRRPPDRPSAAAADRAADAWHIPADCCVVWQTEAHGGHPVSLASLFAQELANQPQVMDQVTSQLIHAAETIGNARLQTVTVGISGQAAFPLGFLVMVLRGQYDSSAVGRALQARRFPMHVADGLSVYGQADSWFFMPGDDRLVVMIGPRPDALDSIVAAVMEGKNDLHDSPDLAPMLKAASAAQPIWGVGKVTQSYRTLVPMLAPFDTVAVEGGVRDHMLHVKFTAAGSDALGAMASVNSFKAEFAPILAQARSALEGQAMYDPLLKALESVHCESSGGTALITLQMPPSLGDAMLQAAGAAPAATQP
jgi:hypothetical protein